MFGPIARLSAFTTTRVNEIETEDCAAISFQMANGAMATSSITLGSAEDKTRIKLNFEHLTAESGTQPYAPMMDQWRFIARNPAKQPEVDAALMQVPEVPSGYAGLFCELSKALDGVPNALVQAEAGRASMELVTAIYASARNGEIVPLPLAGSHPLYAGWQPE